MIDLYIRFCIHLMYADIDLLKKTYFFTYFLEHIVTMIRARNLKNGAGSH